MEYLDDATELLLLPLTELPDASNNNNNEIMNPIIINLQARRTSSSDLCIHKRSKINIINHGYNLYFTFIGKVVSH